MNEFTPEIIKMYEMKNKHMIKILGFKINVESKSLIEIIIEQELANGGSLYDLINQTISSRLENNLVKLLILHSC